jgi:predicted RNA-binding Zn-ribbon protein involved in translation (DUF1610 family)
MKKFYVVNGEYVSAAAAMVAHRNGQPVDVATVAFSDKQWDLVKLISIPGAAQKERSAADKNRSHCKHIAKTVEAYADGIVYRCPDCGEEIRIPDNVGDKYRCPHCHFVGIVDDDDFEQCSVWDYMNDILDIEYRCGSDRKYRSCKIMVACGGPNIYIDTASARVKLYWWTEYAEYPLSYEARDAIDEWAEEYWNI